MIAARAEGVGEAAHVPDQLIVRDVLRKDLEVVKLAGVGARGLRFLLLHRRAGSEKK